MSSRESGLINQGPKSLASPDMSPLGKKLGSQTSKYDSNNLPIVRALDEF